MIIGNRLCKALDGMTIDVDGKTVSVQNNHHDQDALDKFISECDRQGAKKFPLIFVVSNRVQDLRSRRQSTRSIVIMTNTNPDWLSKARTINTFENIIEPIYNKLIPIVERNFQIVNNNLDYVDRANFGIVNGEISKVKSDKSAVTDYIDARIINLTLQYQEGC